MNPIAGAGLVLGLLTTLMLSVRVAQRRGVIGPELSRKAVHIGMGSVCLAFPWIFRTPGPVWVLGGVAAGAMLAVRGVSFLRRELGSVLGGVGRASLGEVYFPFAVAIVFALAAGDAAAFCAPVAILTFADAAGALVGQRWGRRRYQAVESMKSIEGSLAVFAVTCVAVMTVFGLLGNEALLQVMLISVIMGAFAALVEAVSWRGLDNLLVPLVAAAQMKIYPQLTPSELAFRALVMVLLVSMMLTWRSRLLRLSARLGAGLTLYLFWSLGGWPWLVAPVALLASYILLMPPAPPGSERYHLAAVLCIGSAGILWAGLNAWEPSPLWLWLFAVGFAAQQAIIAAVRFTQSHARWPAWRCWFFAAGQAIVVQGIAFVATNGVHAISPSGYAIGAAAVAVALALFMALERDLALPEDLNARWWRQGLTAVLASLAGFALIHL